MTFQFNDINVCGGSYWNNNTELSEGAELKYRSRNLSSCPNQRALRCSVVWKQSKNVTHKGPSGFISLKKTKKFQSWGFFFVCCLFMYCFRFIFFYIWVFFPSVHTEVNRGYWVFWNWLYGWFWTTMRILGIESEFSITSVLICWAISADTRVIIF